MVSIVGGENNPELKRELLEDYRKHCDSEGISYGGPYDDADSVIAKDDGKAVGIAVYKTGLEFRIILLHAVNGAPEDTEERLIRSVSAMAANKGSYGITVNSIDSGGRNFVTCDRLGFEFAGACPCCQRPGMVCMAKKF